MARTQASQALRSETGGIGARSPSRLDHATMLGLIGGFGLVAAAIVLGGAPNAFIDPPSLLIVIGGTLGVTTICFSLQDMARLPTVVVRTLFHSTPDPGATAFYMLRLAELARKRGIMGLDQVLEDMQNEPFIRKAVSLAVDGTSIEEIRIVLEREISETTDRQLRSASMLRKAAEVAPAMGLIGTLIGLVQMLGHLEDPSAIGPGMAVALLTTFYGAILANMVLSPLASKLERNIADEELVAKVSKVAAESICRTDNPRRLELLLNAMLPPSKQINYFS